jgi:hypothetical protein
MERLNANFIFILIRFEPSCPINLRTLRSITLLPVQQQGTIPSNNRAVSHKTMVGWTGRSRTGLIRSRVFAIECLVMKKLVSEHRGQVVSTLDLYSGSLWFKSRPGDRLCCLRVFVVILSPQPRATT